MRFEDRPFQDHRVNPGPDTLRALLSSHQATVYNLCFQILRSAHDAEDAAQDALLEIARAVGSVRDPRAFKRWLCRVTLHTALDHLRRRARRARHEETRAAMKPTPPDPSADAIHEALSRLDDEDRCLLVEKYFERATLEEIGAREGVTAAAMGKRVERAKENLKRKLSGAGLASLSPGVDSMLDSARPAPAVPDLVSTSHAIQAALTLAGGAAMGAKVTVTTTTIVAALLFLTIGAGGGYVVGSKRSDRNRPFATSREMAGNSLPEPEADPPVLNPTPESTTLAPPAATPAAANSLLARLDRFKEWHKDHAAKLKYRTPQDFERTFLLLKEELDGVRELILADPAPFLEWVGRKEHGPYLEDLFHATISLKRSAWSVDVQEFSALPSPLTDGLLKLLESGSVPQRRAVMAVAPYLRNASPEFRNQYVALLSESYDPGIGPAAVNALLFAHEPSPRELDAVVDYAMQLNEPAVRLQVFRSLGKVPREETRTWLLETLESNRLSDPEGRLAYCALEWWTYPGNSPGRDFEERAARLLGAAMERTTEHDPYFMNLHTALNLPLDLSIRLLEQAAASGPNAAVKKAAEAVLQRAKKSGASQTVLREAWIAEFKQK